MSKVPSITEGIQAPDFSLLDQNNKTVTLSALQGKKILLYFYPKASTPGCTVQAQGLRDSKAKLDALNVMVLGISPDSPKKLTNFINKQGLNFSLLADEDKAVCQLYQVWQLKKFMGKEYMGVLRRSFLIDEQGKIIRIFNDFKTKDHHEVVLRFLNQN